ncbi:hypothetical protein ACFL6D_05550, partial [Spirochaetota bacterium]
KPYYQFELTAFNLVLPGSGFFAEKRIGTGIANIIIVAAGVGSMFINHAFSQDAFIYNNSKNILDNKIWTRSGDKYAGGLQFQSIKGDYIFYRNVSAISALAINVIMSYMAGIPGDYYIPLAQYDSNSEYILAYRYGWGF